MRAQSQTTYSGPGAVKIIRMIKLFSSALFWLFFVLPLSLGVLYYMEYASNQYRSTAHFTIEENGKTTIDPIGALTGLSGPVPSTRDALIIKDFIESREVIELIKQKVDIKKLYARMDKDILSRLEPDASIEDIVEYWHKKVRVDFDSSSGITKLSVMAFEPEDAVKIIKSILTVSENLINRLSEKARLDTLHFAEKELKKAEDKLKETRRKVMQFREREKSLSPEKNVEIKISLIASLEADLAKAEADLRGLRAQLQENTPKVRNALNRVSSLKQQIRKEKARGSMNASNAQRKNTKSLSKLIARHEELLTEQSFAEKSYESALVLMEQARIDAAKQHRYLTVIVQPQLPEEAVKPDQPHDYIVLFLSCLLFWGISTLVIASIRDHAGWV